MKRKGFTLIELLAVIVILSIIALIATPVLYKIINDAKISAFKNKIYAIDKASNTYYENLILEGNEEEFTKGLDGTYSLTLDLSKQSDKEKLEIKGKTISKGLVTITDEGKVSITALDDKLCGQKLSSSEVVNMLSIKDDFACYLLDSSSSDIGTNDILTAIQKLKDSNENLSKLVQELTTSNKELKDTIGNMSNNIPGTPGGLDKIYPVGSIYISTTLKTTEEVTAALGGGEWVSYGDGRVLRGTTGEANQTGGNSDISLTTANLPSHSHPYKPAGKVTSKFTGTATNSGSTGSGYAYEYTYANRTSGANNVGHTHGVNITTTLNGAHKHRLQGWSIQFSSTQGGFYALTTRHDYDNFDGNYSSMTSEGNHQHQVVGNTGTQSANHTHSYRDYYVKKITGVESHYHSVTATGNVTSTFAGTASNTDPAGSDKPTGFSVLDPYITVYMYKRKS